MRRIRRLLWALMALCVLCGAMRVSLAEEEAIPLPTLDPDRIPYDDKHPEILYPGQLYCWSCILIEAESGEVIFEKDADAIRFPASTTKIMTALVALNVLGDEGLDGTAVVSAEALYATQQESDVTTLKLQEGEEINVRTLLAATLVYSANDGASVIAEYVAGSIPAFVDMMNEYAVMYGCYNTHFTNPHGLHDDDHYTTARDLATITRYAMQNETFRDMVFMKTVEIPATNKHRARSVNTTNQLFNPGTAEKPNKYYYADIIGVKTGYTAKAQYCFVGAAERDGVTLISVIMYAGDNSRWADTIKLMNYGFSQYTSVSPIELYEANPISIQTSGYSLQDPAMGTLTLTCVAASQEAKDCRVIDTFDHVEEMKANLQSIVMIDYTRDFTAPIRAGDVVGTMTWLQDNGVAVTYNLVASRSVAARENLPPTLEEIEQRSDADPNPFPPFVDLILPLLALIAATVGLYFLIRTLLFGRSGKPGKGPQVKHRYLR